VDAGGAARTRAVTLGDGNAGFVEILSGTSEGDRLVADLDRPIADGTPVRGVVR